MNPRERTLAIVVGGAMAVFVLYKSVNMLLLEPLQEARLRIKSLEDDNRRLDGKLRSRSRLARRWLDYGGRTLSMDRTQASDRFGHDLKEIAKRHGLGGANVAPTSGTYVGSKTKIKTVGCRISTEGRFDEVVDFLRELYETPYLCQITKLSVSPTGRKGERGRVKVELTVETPVLPKIDREDIPEASRLETLPLNPAEPPGPARHDLLDDSAFLVLAERNILRPYLPPPVNIVVIDNQDWKTAVVRMRFFWDGKVREQPIEAVPGKSQQSVQGAGDVLELEAIYADGEAFGPKRLAARGTAPWRFVVPVHSPAPPPKSIDLAVDNRDPEAIDLKLVVTHESGKTESLPDMRFKARARMDVWRFENVKSVKVTATYASGKVAMTKTFTPGNDKQTLTVNPESAPQRVADRPQPVKDRPADARFLVTGLLTYRDTHEMIGTAGSERRIFVAGADGAVDGGTLLAVHPLGGVVRMPTGNYYIYPMGRKFTERVLLDAQTEQDLPVAIDLWASK